MTTTSISGGGNHTVSIYGNGNVTLGDGNNSVNIGGTGSVLVGNGRDTIAVGGSGTVRAGSGNDNIKVMGSGSMSVGGGQDLLRLNGSGRIVQTGSPGRDTISLGMGSDTIIVQGRAVVSEANLPTFSARQVLNIGAGDLNYVADAYRYRGEPIFHPAYLAATAGSATVVGGQLQVVHSHGVTVDMAVSGTATLVGGFTATMFVGGAGSTVMKGGSGEDTFVGGSGRDVMTGVGNRNVFEFLASNKGGQHVIMNFVAGDQLNVEGHTLAYLNTHNEVTSHGGNTFISVDGGRTSIELQGVPAATESVSSHLARDMNHIDKR